MSTNKPRRLLWMPLDDFPESILSFMKYFPKYYNKVETTVVTLTSNKVRSKIKKVKIIRSLNIKEHNVKSFSGKIRDLKSFSQTVNYAYIKDPRISWMFTRLNKVNLDVYKLDSWKLFERSVKIKELNIDFINYSFTRNLEKSSPKIKKYLEYRFWRHMKRLTDLNSLDIQISNEFNSVTHRFLEKLNNSKDILKNLSNFIFFLNHANILDGQNPPVLDNLFPKITQIQLHELNCTILQHILDHLDQFISLNSFRLIQNLQVPYASESSKINFASLAKLKSINSLKLIEISINLSLHACFESFLQNFALPPSTESVTFNFFDIHWKTFLPGIQNTKFDIFNPFEASDLCQTFFSCWKGLEKLNSLSLAFTESEETPLSSLYFTIPILERVTRLETLHYSHCYSMGSGKRKPLDFGYFWDKIRHLHPTLKNLFIETYAISLRKVEEVMKSTSCLEKIGICGFMLGELQLEHFLDLFKDNTNKKGNLKMELERVVVDKGENFPKFLQILKRVSRRLDLSIGVDVRKIDPNFFVQCLYEFYEGENFQKDKLQVCFYNVNAIESNEFCILCEMICKKEMFMNVRMLDKEEEEVFNSEAAKEFEVILEQDIRKYKNLDNQVNTEGNNLEESSYDNDLNGEDDEDFDSMEMSEFFGEEISESLEGIDEEDF